MTRPSQCRILRSYRNKAPSRFYNILLKVWKCLTDNPKIPAAVWAAHPELLSSFLAEAAKYHEVYQRASLYSSKLDIAAREVLQAQLVDHMDEIASVLEAASIRNPEVIVTSGFELCKDHRTISRTNIPQTPSEDVKVSDAEKTNS